MYRFLAFLQCYSHIYLACILVVWFDKPLVWRDDILSGSARKCNYFEPHRRSFIFSAQAVDKTLRDEVLLGLHLYSGYKTKPGSHPILSFVK